MRRSLKLAAAAALVAVGLASAGCSPVDAKAHQPKRYHGSGHQVKQHQQPQHHDEVSIPALVRQGISVHQTHEPSAQELAQLTPLAIRPRRKLLTEDENGEAEAQAASSVLTIDVSDVRQAIIGFGGAITEAAVTVLNQMPASALEEVLEAYYSEQGNQYSLGRVPINSCDFSVVGQWNFDNTTDDFELNDFDHNLTHEQEYLLPFLHQVQKVAADGFKLFGSPWSPPQWMKGNGQMDGSSFPGLKEDPQYHAAWALYLSTWFTAMKNQGITAFWGMTVQNEPEFAAPWEACVYTPEQERDFIIDYLGPQMQADHPEITIMAYDHNKDHVAIWADAIFASNASQYVGGLAVHWYSGDQFDNLNATHAAWPDKFILATEATTAGPPTLQGVGAVTKAEAYAHDIIGDLQNWVGGWTDWNIVLDMQGGPNHLKNYCDAPIIADTAAGVLHYNPMYFYLGHFSRFLPGGNATHRVGQLLESTDPAVQALEIVAFVVDTSANESQPKLATTAAAPAAGPQVIVVVLNRQNTTASFQVALAGGQYEATVTAQAHSIQTLQFDARLA